MQSLPVGQSLAGLDNFALYFVTSLVLLLLFKWIYPFVTPHKEWHLVKQERNSAAATAFAGAFLGFSIALASAVSHSVAYVDFVVWGLIALIAQIIAYFIVRVVMNDISQRIQAQEMSAGIIAGGTSLAVGILNAACMTY